MGLSFHTPLFVVVLLLTASFAVSYFLYRFTVPQVSTGKRIILILLRGTALSLLLLAVCEPLFRLIYSEEQRPVIAVLADNSLSMSQQDGAGDRSAILASVLNGNGIRQLAASADVRFFSFSHSVQPLAPESLHINGGTTNISGALQSSLRTIDDLQGIILISDGNYNAGANPLYDAEKSRIPVFTAGIGDTSEQKDISVSKLITNAIGYVDAAIPVDATIKASGITNRTVTAALFEDGKKINEQNITVSSANGTTEIPLQFQYIPKSDGSRKLTVSVPGIEGELTAKNNSRSAMVKVLKSKMNIVVIAGTVSPDVAAVMQTLDADVNIDAQLFYELPNGTFRSRSKAKELQPSIAGADAVIMIGFPAAAASSTSVEMIRQSITSGSVSVLFIASRLLDLQKVRAMESLFPFTVASERMDEQMILPSVAPSFKLHQLLQNETTSWEKLPPLYYSLPTFTAKPEAQVMVSVKIQNVPLTNPLFLIRNIGNTKSAALLGYGIHRWKVLAGSAGETKGFFAAWFSSLVRWLATREQDKFLRVEPSKGFYSQGERIEFSGQVYNESYQPVDDADVQLTMRPLNGTERTETSLNALGSGLYDGSFDGLPEGEYQFTAAALRSGDTLGTASGRISVGEQSVEFAETKMNKTLLQQIAAASGGIYTDAAAFDQMAEKILARQEMKTQLRTRATEYELWNLPSFLAVIVLLFGIEWLIRKQSGML
jgi:hypothetical protein